MLKTMCVIISLYIFTKYWSKSYLTTVLSSSVIMFARAEPIGNPIDITLVDKKKTSLNTSKTQPTIMYCSWNKIIIKNALHN